MVETTASTSPERILAVSLQLFGTRGFEATSLDAIAAEVGLRKQTILYWFPSKEALLDAVGERSAQELRAALEDALDGAEPGFGRVETVMATVFRFAVRRPALLGLLRELSRLGPEAAAELAERLAPLTQRAIDFLDAEMDAGTIRRADPRLLLVFVYATVVGVATETEVQRAVGLSASPAGLRRLRRELFAFVRAALGAPA
jgi:AcrR family transcriptional regulator